MGYGMISYFVPLSKYPKGYLDQSDVPLPYISLASQKKHMALYLMCFYGNENYRNWFDKEYKKSGKKRDVGKSCIRFKTLGDLPIDLIRAAVAKVPVKKFIEKYEQERFKTSRKRNEK
jgi:hypothetical protein